MLPKFPDLQFALSEGGIGWIPYFLERIDYIYKHHHAWTGQDFGDRLPSEVFHEHIITCFIDDAVGIEKRDHINIDTIMLGVRLPALRLDVAALARACWPSRSTGVPDDEIDKITPRERDAAVPLRPVLA